MRNLLKLKLRALLWTEFLFRYVLRYFQVFVKKKILRFFGTPKYIYIYIYIYYIHTASTYNWSALSKSELFIGISLILTSDIRITDKLVKFY